MANGCYAIAEYWNLSVQTKGHQLRMERNNVPMGVYHRRGCLIAESQERVARAKPLPGEAVRVSTTTNFPLRTLAREGGQGDEVDQFVDLTSIVWKSPLNRLLMSRMASGPFQFKGMDEGNTRAFLFFNV